MAEPVPDAYRPYVVEYEASPVMHTWQDVFMVRFGHTDNMTVVLAGDMEETKDYLLGLIFLGAIILGIFLIWAITLLIFMCVRRPVGFLSGLPFERKLPREEAKTPPTPTTTPHVEVQQQELQQHRQPGTDSFDFAELDISIDGGDRMNQTNDSSAVLDQKGSISKPPEKGPDIMARNDTYYGSSSEPMSHGDPWKSRPSRARIVFIFSGAVCFTFGVLMVTKGITNLNQTMSTVSGRSTDTMLISKTAKKLIRDGFLDMVDTADALRTSLKYELSDEIFCPNLPPGVPAQNSVVRDMQIRKNRLLLVLDNLSGFEVDSMQNLEETMESVADTTSDVSDITENYSVSDWQALIVLIPYTIFPSLLMLAAMMALFDVTLKWYTCFIMWFVMPIFVLMSSAAFVIAGLMTVGAGVNSDFCLPGGDEESSPDEILLSSMEMNGIPKGSFTYNAAQFYIEKCYGMDPLGEVRDLLPDLVNNTDAVKNLMGEMLNENKLNEMSVVCNRDYDVIPPLLFSMTDVLAVLTKSVIHLLDLASCPRIVPLYTGVVYDAGCSYAPSAVMWIFSCSLILGFFGMIMITLRSSMKATLLIEDNAQPPSLDKIQTYTVEDMDTNADNNMGGQYGSGYDEARYDNYDDDHYPQALAGRNDAVIQDNDEFSHAYTGYEIEIPDVDIPVVADTTNEPTPNNEPSHPYVPTDKVVQLY